MKLQLSHVNWSEKFDGKDVNTFWLLFKDILQDMVQKHVPLVSSSGEKKSIIKPLQKRTVRMIKSGNVCWKKYGTGPSQRNYDAYKKQRNKEQSLTNEYKDNNRKQLTRSCKDNRKKF